MKPQLIFILISLIGFTSCDDSYQYDVYAKNSTAENIKIVFKSSQDIVKTDEQTILLKPGESKRIISTSNISLKEQESKTINHCQRAAEYIKAYKGLQAGKVDWCDQEIKFELEDIGQWSFTIDYKPEHF